MGSISNALNKNLNVGSINESKSVRVMTTAINAELQTILKMST